MKRLINARYAVLLAFAVGLGAGFSYLSAFYSFPYWWMIALVPLTAALVIICIVRAKYRALIFFVISAVLFVVGAGGVYHRLSAYNTPSLVSGSVYSISGTVYEKSFTENGEYIKLKDITADGKEAQGNMTVYLAEDYGQFCDVGYTVEFEAQVNVSSAFAYGNVYSERLLDDVRYTAYPQGKLTSEYGFSLFGSINSAVRSLFFDNLPYDSASLAYAMFTGNTDFIETGTMDSFRYGGTAHVFAVSGMHIVLVYGVVSFILKRLRTGPVPAALLSIFAVFFYTGMCGFTLSAVRAAIMCAVAEVVKISCGKYDMLSSLALSFTAIMLVNPLNIISVGFQLSVAAVAGIALFNSKINGALRRIKIPQKISSSASIALSAQLATFPILLSSFGYVSWASLGLNLVFVPLISADFLLLFPATILSLIIRPIAGFVLLVPCVPLDAITSVLVAIHAENALISGFDFGAFAPIYFCALVLLSDKINLKFSVRAATAVVLAVILAACVFLKNFVPGGQYRIIASAYYGGSQCVLIKAEEGNILIISENPSSYDISSLLGENAAEDISAIIICGGEESAFAYFMAGAECDDVYVNYTNIHIQPVQGVTFHYEKQFTLNGINFEFTDGYSVMADFGTTDVGICMGYSVPFESCDVLFAVEEDTDCNSPNKFYFEQVNSSVNVYDCGDLQFVLKDGKIFSAGSSTKKGALI